MKQGGLTPRQMTLWLVLAAIGIFLRFAAIDRSYWFDELATVNNVDAPDLRTVVETTSQDNQPPLYNSTAFVWTHLFGFSEIAVRSLSVLYGLLALLTPWFARRSLDRTEKLLIFTILCLMPLPIRYAQEARNYSLLFLLSSACLFLYYETFIDKSRRLQILLYASLLLLAFSHLFGLLLAVSFVAVMFWRERRIFPRLALVAFAAGLSAAILVPLIHGGSGELTGGKFWITFSAGSVSRQLLTVLSPVGIVLLVYAVTLWRRTPDRATLDAALAPSLMPFVLMLAGSIVISFNTPILTDRNLIGLIPAFALLSGCLLQRALARRSATTTTALLCLLLLQGLVLTYSPYLFIQQDFRTIALHSIAANSKVCYVVPMTNEQEHLPHRLYSFYIARLLNRPDLTPELMRPSEVPADLSSNDCSLWADAALSRRGVSLLRTFPQFRRCSDVPLGKHGVRMASELLDCRS